MVAGTWKWLMKAHPTALCIVAAVGILAVQGCRSDSTAPEIIEPPSFIRVTVPADSTENVYGVTDLSITFRRPVPEGGIALQIYPGPLSAGPTVLSRTRRNVTWLEVELDRDRKAYRLLVDGASMPFPEMIELFPGKRPGITGRMGGCLSLLRPRPDLNEAVVFAFLPGDFDLSAEALPLLFRGQHPEMIALVDRLPGECESFYFLTYLDVVPHVIIAVIDTSGDGRYDLYDDWWGSLGSTFAVAVRPSASPFDVPMNLNIAIGPPR